MRNVKPHLFAHLHTAGQSVRKVGLIVGLSVLESYKKLLDAAPLIPTQDWCGGLEFQMLLDDLVRTLFEIV